MIQVNKKILILTSGVIWLTVGVLLIKIASRWFAELSSKQLLFSVIVGIVSGNLIAFFGFGKLAKKNIKRINSYSSKVCFFAFQTWRSYILILIMVSMGIFLRKTSFAPKIILTPMYIGIGFALFTASFRYYKSFFKS